MAIAPITQAIYHASAVSLLNTVRKSVGSAYRVKDAYSLENPSPPAKVIVNREAIVLGITFGTNVGMQLGLVPLKQKLGKYYAPLQFTCDMLSLMFAESAARVMAYKGIKQNPVSFPVPAAPALMIPAGAALASLTSGKMTRSGQEAAATFSVSPLSAQLTSAVSSLEASAARNGAAKVQTNPFSVAKVTSAAKSAFNGELSPFQLPVQGAHLRHLIV
jgi:hypothetical protein